MTATDALDYRHVHGQEAAKRALLVAAAGEHNILLTGPPGVGKTMLAQRLPGILPPLTAVESTEVARLRSAAGLLTAAHLCQERPFRAPHHTVSITGLMGGGTPPRPGEVSLAHRGVLFLDELPEFPRKALEALREPLEDGRITIARSSGSVTFPAQFLLVGAMNPCPCGNLGHPSRACRCRPHQVEDYRHRLDPIIDFFDIHIDIRPMGIDPSGTRPEGLSSAYMRARVEEARQFVALRPPENTEGTLAKTIANLDSSPTIDRRHREEAAAYLHLKG